MITMKIVILSNQELSSSEKNKIKQIMKESQCPNESLQNTFPNRYCCIDKEVIVFDKENRKIRTELEY